MSRPKSNLLVCFVAFDNWNLLFIVLHFDDVSFSTFVCVKMRLRKFLYQKKIPGGREVRNYQNNICGPFGLAVFRTPSPLATGLKGLCMRQKRTSLSVTFRAALLHASTSDLETIYCRLAHVDARPRPIQRCTCRQTYANKLTFPFNNMSNKTGLEHRVAIPIRH